MPPLPVLSGSDVIKALSKLGYSQVRQRGSHVRLVSLDSGKHPPVTVPLHKQLDRGTLRSIIRDANLTVNEFINLTK